MAKKEEVVEEVQQDDEPKFIGFPRVQVLSSPPMNDEGEIIVGQDGKPLTAGLFYHRGLDTYAKEFKFRPFKYMLSYLKYTDPASNDFSLAGRSIYAPVKKGYYADGIYDTLGGERCGRPIPKVLREKPDDEQKKIRQQNPVYTHLFGIAYFEGHDPVVTELRFGGKRIIQMGDVVENAITSQAKVNRQGAAEIFDRELPKHLLEFNLDKVYILDKDGKPTKKARLAPNGNPMFTIGGSSVEYDLPIKDVTDELNEVLDYIKTENEKVMSEYGEVRTVDSLVEELTEDSEPPLNDDLPF